MRIRICPPPPKPVIPVCVTPRTNPMATAASIALPPAFKTAMPTSVAFVSPLTAIAWRALTGMALCRAAGWKPDTSKRIIGMNVRTCNIYYYPDELVLHKTEILARFRLQKHHRMEHESG